MDSESIESFTGQYSFLSNFYRGGGVEPTVEHHYQAAKTLDQEESDKILSALTPGKAKRLGRHVSLRPDWENRKIDFMFRLLVKKFSDPDLKRKLLATGNLRLVEGNTWGDTFWGVYKGEGFNALGQLLEIVRNHYRRLDNG